MSSHFHNPWRQLRAGALAIFAVLCGVSTLAAAQDQPAPKWELYGGYSFFDPGCDVHGLLPGGTLPVSSCLKSNPRGVGASLTYNFNRWFGLTADSSGNWGSGETTPEKQIEQVAFYNFSGGPKLTFRSRYFSPFLEGLVGWHHLTSDLFDGDDRFGFMAGGGLDLNLSKHIAWRLIRADFVFSNHHFGPEALVPATEVRGARLQTGIVFMFGGGPDGPPLAASCTLNPSLVMSGEPVTATATPGNFNSRHALTYTWNSTGGKIRGKDDTASINIDTNRVPGGSYRVTANISDPRRKKAGQATCMAAFTVKELPKNPPIIACSADPSTVVSGNSSTIRCTCTSPDDARVAVGGWTTSGGSVSSISGDTAALNTSGASAGTITVNATCNDARGLNAQTTAQVLVENPPLPSPEFQRLEARLSLHSIYFPTARPTVQNPEGGLLSSQEQTLVPLAVDFRKYLETKPDAHLTLEGHADPRASVEYNQALSERRVERVRRFLIEHGVPEASLETKAFGDQHNLSETQVRDAVERNPELTPAERRAVLGNMTTILLASNRRVDITLSTTGQKSIREYPFNAADSLTLIRQAGTRKTTAPAPRKKVKTATRQ